MMNLTKCVFASMYEGTFLDLKWSHVLHNFETQNIDARIKFSDDGDTLVAIGSKNMPIVVLSAQNGLLIASAQVPIVTSVLFNYQSNIKVTPKNATGPLSIFLQTTVISNYVNATIILKLSLIESSTANSSLGVSWQIQFNDNLYYFYSDYNSLQLQNRTLYSAQSFTGSNKNTLINSVDLESGIVNWSKIYFTGRLLQFGIFEIDEFNSVLVFISNIYIDRHFLTNGNISKTDYFSLGNQNLQYVTAIEVKESSLRVITGYNGIQLVTFDLIKNTSSIQSIQIQQGVYPKISFFMSGKDHFLTLYTSTESLVTNLKVTYLPFTMNLITTSNSSISQDIYSQNKSLVTGSISNNPDSVYPARIDIILTNSSLNYIKIVPTQYQQIVQAANKSTFYNIPLGDIPVTITESASLLIYYLEWSYSCKTQEGTTLKIQDFVVQGMHLNGTYLIPKNINCTDSLFGYQCQIPLITLREELSLWNRSDPLIFRVRRSTLASSWFYIPKSKQYGYVMSAPDSPANPPYQGTNQNSNSIQIRWYPLYYPQNGLLPIEKYQIFMRNVTDQQQEFSLVANASSSATSLILTGLTPFSYYEFKYRAINVLGVGGNSSTVSLVSGTAPASPSTPLNISIDWNSTSTIGVRFDWKAYNSSASNIPVAYYQIYASDGYSYIQASLVLRTSAFQASQLCQAFLFYIPGKSSPPPMLGGRQPAPKCTSSWSNLMSTSKNRKSTKQINYSYSK